MPQSDELHPAKQLTPCAATRHACQHLSVGYTCNASAISSSSHVAVAATKADSLPSSTVSSPRTPSAVALSTAAARAHRAASCSSCLIWLCHTCLQIAPVTVYQDTSFFL